MLFVARHFGPRLLRVAIGNENGIPAEIRFAARMFCARALDRAMKHLNLSPIAVSKHHFCSCASIIVTVQKFTEPLIPKCLKEPFEQRPGKAFERMKSYRHIFNKDWRTHQLIRTTRLIIYHFSQVKRLYFRQVEFLVLNWQMKMFRKIFCLCRVASNECEPLFHISTL